MKKVGIAIATIILTITTVASLAYLTSKESVKNSFGIGKIEATVVENFDENNAKDLSTNKSIEKTVAVTNTGKNPEIVRVIINPQWKGKSNDNNIPVSASNQVKLNFRKGFENDWIEGKDGYYYYKHILKPKNNNTGSSEGDESKTSTLLESVSINKNITDEEKKEFSNRELVVNVSAEAIQVNYDAIKESWNINNTMDKDVLNYFDELINKK
ncbi:SipW-dependent-type signal peptide-containing protein [Clostridium baratii]|uniref:SipW-dependent-type signal peptide-containing protein n=1 Tax=Clostridium baratii TaxID=1561 RepID=UPI002A7621AB|nr:SipW-dependent-type signal peptide-containing protein [Clostridium baratii]MDY3208440.1 SipW-dependent-type signal peptide-containing protein [Clostridium baratii]